MKDQFLVFLTKAWQTSAPARRMRIEEPRMVDLVQWLPCSPNTMRRILRSLLSFLQHPMYFDSCSQSRRKDCCSGPEAGVVSSRLPKGRTRPRQQNQQRSLGLVSMSSSRDPSRHTTCKIGQGRIDPTIQHIPLAVLVCPEKYHSSWKRAQHRCCEASIKSSLHALLAEDFDVRIGQRCVFRRKVRIALLSGLDGVERVHQNVAACSADATGKHRVRIWWSLQLIIKTGSGRHVYNARRSYLSCAVDLMSGLRKPMLGRLNRSI